MSHDLQAAYAVSQIRHQSAQFDPAIVGWLRDQGRIAIVRETMAYCPITDATLPSPHRFLAATADDEADVGAVIAALHARNEDDEVRFDVYPRPAGQARAFSWGFEPSQDECPF